MQLSDSGYLHCDCELLTKPKIDYMNILLLCGLFPFEYKENIIKSSKGVIQYAADTLQWSFVKGLTHFYNKIELINLPYIGSFPKYYTKSREKNYEFNIYENQNSPKAKNIGFNNFFGIRLFSRYYNAKRAIQNWATSIEGEKVIIIYAIHEPFIEAVIKIKKKYSDIKICLIVPDLPDYMADGSKLYTLLKSLRNKRLNKSYQHIDYFIFLTENMKNVIPVEGKRYTVIEGIYDNELKADVLENETENEIKTIFYGGTLAHRYGVLNLVNAFTKLDNKNYRLIICGDGSAKDEIRKIAQTDERIIYKGQIPREMVLNLISKSDLLVNPRTPEGEFTKYSFPSKTMEYLGSGIPTLLYKLEGIPEEYYTYCFALEDISVDVLTLEIDKILSMPREVRLKKSTEAKKFILSEKNPIKQCEKITRLIQ